MKGTNERPRFAFVLAVLVVPSVLFLSASCGDDADADSDADGDTDYLPGDEMAPWEGGPSYYGAWSNGPPTDPSFFPVAVWLQEPSAATAAQYRDIGVNLHVGLWDGPTEAQLEAVAALPSLAFADQNDVGLASSHSGVIRAWTQIDEPDNAQNGTEDPMPTADVVAAYDAMVAADATRPVFLNLGQGVATDLWYGRGNRTGHPEDYAAYAQGGDILSYDIYPMNVLPLTDTEGLEDWYTSYYAEVAESVWYVAVGVDRLREWSGYEKPVWAWIETTNYNGQDGVALTPEITKAEVWMALVHGARGIGYFCHVFAPSFVEAGLLADAEMAAGVHAVNDQIAELAPVLNTQSVANGVTTVSSDEGVPVDTMVKREGGDTYLFAVSMRPAETTATFTLRDFAGEATVEVLGESRTLTATDGVFSDGFAGYAVHLYRVATP